MAENKKSIIIYADWIEIFEALGDEEAGKLIKHFFRYVNDLNPPPPDRITELSFILIKQQLKRDLDKWEVTLEERSKAGALGNLKRWNKDIYEKVSNNEITLEEGVTLSQNRKTSQLSQSIANIADNVNVNVNVNDTVTVNEDDIKKEKKINILLSEIKISDVGEKDLFFYESALAFWKLFRQTQIDKNVVTTTLDKARYHTWITPIRLLLTADKFTQDDLRKVFKFLQTDDFWGTNIQSTVTLREKFTQLLLKANTVKNGKKRNNPSGVSDEYLQGIMRDLES